MSWFCVTSNLFASRMNDGSVLLVTTEGSVRPDEGGNITSSYTIDAGIWCSLVLSMTVFDERPNDWRAFMEHHQGRSDILAAPKRQTVVEALAESRKWRMSDEECDKLME